MSRWVRKSSRAKSLGLLLGWDGLDKLTPATRASALSRLATKNSERVALWGRHWGCRW